MPDPTPSLPRTWTPIAEHVENEVLGKYWLSVDGAPFDAYQAAEMREAGVLLTALKRNDAGRMVLLAKAAKRAVSTNDHVPHTRRYRRRRAKLAEEIPAA